jgi:hypothetical protein
MEGFVFRFAKSGGSSRIKDVGLTPRWRILAAQTACTSGMRRGFGEPAPLGSIPTRFPSRLRFSRVTHRAQEAG